MRKFHIALSIKNLEQSILDYSKRLNCSPCLVIPNEYALWRTDELNFSIRQTGKTEEKLRHLGWEDNQLTEEVGDDEDVNGIVWENFSASQQAEEINNIWSDTNYIVIED